METCDLLAHVTVLNRNSLLGVNFHVILFFILICENLDLLNITKTNRKRKHINKNNNIINM